MRKVFLTVAGVGVALTAIPAQAEKHYSDIVTCSKVKEGKCVEYKRLTRGAAARISYDVGYKFAPTYGFTDLTAIPPDVVTKYSLATNERYVYQNGYVYVVNPALIRSKK